MCREKGLDILVDTYIRADVGDLEWKTCVLQLDGGCGPAHEPFVAEQKAKLTCGRT